VQLASFVWSVPRVAFYALHLTAMALGGVALYRHWDISRRNAKLPPVRIADPFAPRTILPVVPVLLAAAALLNLIVAMFGEIATDADIMQGAGLRVFAASWMFFALALRVDAIVAIQQLARVEAAEAKHAGRAA
jgi:hypothetical protein